MTSLTCYTFRISSIGRTAASDAACWEFESLILNLELWFQQLWLNPNGAEAVCDTVVRGFDFLQPPNNQGNWLNFSHWTRSASTYAARFERKGSLWCGFESSLPPVGTAHRLNINPYTCGIRLRRLGLQPFKLAKGDCRPYPVPSCYTRCVGLGYFILQMNESWFDSSVGRSQLNLLSRFVLVYVFKVPQLNGRASPSTVMDIGSIPMGSTFPGVNVSDTSLLMKNTP